MFHCTGKVLISTFANTSIDVAIYPSKLEAVLAMLNSGCLADNCDGHGSEAHKEALHVVLGRIAEIQARIAECNSDQAIGPEEDEGRP